jgi:hypothetical protein
MPAEPPEPASPPEPLELELEVDPATCGSDSQPTRTNDTTTHVKKLRMNHLELIGKAPHMAPN